MDTLAAGLLVGRVSVGLIIAAHGRAKAPAMIGGGGFDAAVEDFRHHGLAATRADAVLTVLGQLGGGLLTALGLGGPLGPAAMVGVMLIATAVKARGGFWDRGGGCEYPLMLTLLAAATALTGPGDWSLDNAVGWSFDGRWSVGALAGAGVLAAGSWVRLTRKVVVDR